MIASLWRHGRICVLLFLTMPPMRFFPISDKAPDPAIEDGVALAVFLERRTSGGIVGRLAAIRSFSPRQLRYRSGRGAEAAFG